MAFGFAFRCLTNRPHSNSEKPELDQEPKLLVIDTTVACSLSNLPKATPELRTEALRTSPTAPIGRRLGTAPLPKEVHGGSLSRLDSTESVHRGRSPESQVRRVERAPRFASGSEEPSSKPRFRFRRRGRDHVSIRTLAPTEVGVGTRNKAPFELPLPTFANGCPSPTEVDYEHSTAQPAAWSVFDCRSRRLRLVSLAEAKSIQQWFQARRSATNRLAQHLYLSSSHRLPLRRAPRGTTRSKNQRRLP